MRVLLVEDHAELAETMPPARGGRFPGGVLFVDLRGYDPAPTEPAETLATFLRALGLPDSQIPVGQGELETTYRSLLAHRAADAGDVLVLLDNASSSSQIRPLLPGSGAHQVLLCSTPTSPFPCWRQATRPVTG
jgi:hypothetical protein